MNTISQRLQDRRALQSFVTFILILSAMGSVNAGVAAFVIDIDSLDLLPVVAFALLAGWFFGRMSLSWRRSAAAAIFLGFCSSLIFAGRLGPLFGSLFMALRELLGAALSQQDTGALNLVNLIRELASIGTAIVVLWGRCLEWLRGWLVNRPTHDPIASVFLWSFLLWCVSFWATWITRRRGQPMAGLAPGGAILAFGLAYSFAEPLYLLYFLGALLFLLVISRQAALERYWSDSRLDFPEDISLDHYSVGVGLSIFLLAAALMIPSLSVRPIASLVGRLTRDMMNESLELAAAMGVKPGGQPVNPAGGLRFGGLPRDHLIGSGPELEEIVVMTVLVEEGTGVAGSPYSVPERFYWRSVTYDGYTGHGWASRLTQRLAYEPGEIVLSTSFPGQALIQQKVQYLADFGGSLHVAGQLVSANQPFEIEWRIPPGLENRRGQPVGDELEDIFGSSTEALAFEAKSLVARPSQSQLRGGGGDYPPEIASLYLQLPPGLPGRVHALAHELTEGKSSSFDKASALEAFLRTYPYNLDLPAPPADRDVVEYFLFDLRQGYCDYYATSMVVMARAIGLPARLVVGYASGTYDQELQRYVVTAADAHSWVEIFFPKYGWVEFEPTGNRPTFDRPEIGPVESFDVGSRPAAEVAPGSSGYPESSAFWRGLGGWLLGFVAVPGGVVLLWWHWPVLVGIWLRNKSPDLALVAMFKTLYKSAHRLDIAVDPGVTAAEFASCWLDRWQETIPGSPSWIPLNQPSAELGWLVQIHGRALFSAHPLDRSETNTAIQVWSRLVRQLWLLGIVRQLRSIRVLAQPGGS